MEQVASISQFAGYLIIFRTVYEANSNPLISSTKPDRPLSRIISGAMQKPEFYNAMLSMCCAIDL
jgi:hypothetical protein